MCAIRICKESCFYGHFIVESMTGPICLQLKLKYMKQKKKNVATRSFSFLIIHCLLCKHEKYIVSETFNINLKSQNNKLALGHRVTTHYILRGLLVATNIILTKDLPASGEKREEYLYFTVIFPFQFICATTF